MKEFNSFNNYLKSLEKCQFLTAQEEKELIKKAQAGNIKARDRIIQANLRFVVDQAKKMVRKGCPADIEDLISAGNMGLVKAVSKFKAEKNVRFVTCAAFWILAEMREEAGMTYAIRLPHNSQLLLSKIRLVEANLPKEVKGLTQAEKYEYIARETGATAGTVKAIIESTGSIASLDAFIQGTGEGDDEASLYSFFDDKSAEDPADEMAAKDFSCSVRKVLKKLPEDERKVLERHYGLNREKAETLDEIAGSWDKKITREGVRQKELKAVRHFYEPENLMLFEGFFNKAV